MPSRKSWGTGRSLLLLALLCPWPAQAADRDDVFRQWEKPPSSTPQAPAQAPAPKAADTGSGARQARAEVVDFGDFLPVYSSTVKYASVEKLMRESQINERIADALNDVFALPTNIRIDLRECGQVNAFYEPASRSIVTCYELLEQLFLQFSRVLKDDQKAADALDGASRFIFFHELGHALISVWNLPITGREEDAVDQLASYITLHGGRDGVAAALSAAMWFALSGDNPTAAHYADEHSLNQQRFFNIVCWIYGSDPEFYGPLVAEDFLPKGRAQKCPYEFAKLLQAWDKLLDPFLKR